ncbi:MAG: hypothetical protein CMP28_14505, partial [Roseibacillus sp.]|nr:hypothetical protein [Roseibacillus sp.]
MGSCGKNRSPHTDDYSPASLRIPIPSPVLAAVISTVSLAGARDNPALAQLAVEYRPEVRVLLERYCFECHSGDEAEGEIDLESFETMEDVRRSPGTWLQVREILE